MTDTGRTDGWTDRNSVIDSLFCKAPFPFSEPSQVDLNSFIMADIPGIIEGASSGKGLGYRFLRHIERNSCLLFLVSSDSNDPYNDYQTLVKELKKYNPDLLNKDRLLVITKSDLINNDTRKTISNKLSIRHVFISSITNKGLEILKDKIWSLLNKKNDD